MKQTDEQIIQSLRGETKYSKIKVKKLVKIYKAHTGEKVANCFCSASERKSWAKFFFEWWDTLNNINQDDSGETFRNI
jgi:hypothetical protein